MKNNPIKMTALPLMAALAFPAFAGTYNSALQPYPPDTGNVEINFQTINQLKPTNVTGPTTYSGTAIINMAVSNLSGNPVTVACTGPNLNVSVCTGASSDVTNCTWTNEDTALAVTMPTLSAIPAGTSATTTLNLSVVTPTAAGWGAVISTTAALPCTITDTITSDVSTKIFYVPVS